MTNRTDTALAPIDPRLVISALWITMLFVFAYVDIFAFFRADVLTAALDGTIAATGFAADQFFFVATTAYILLPSLMVVLSLVLRPAVVRIATIVMASLYAVGIAVSCIGETWAYYLLGSAVEITLLAAMVAVAWRWKVRPARQR